MSENTAPAKPEITPELLRELVHPELLPVVEILQARLADYPPMSDEILPVAREAVKSFSPPRLADIPVVIRHVPGGKGHPDVRICITNAKPGESRPGIVHMHGGLYVLDEPSRLVGFHQIIARDLDCTFVSVDYRLAPETTYAGSVEDTHAALTWVYHHADELGIDPARIAVMGESAGGGHAALLAIAARDRGEVPIAFQCLTYPMIDDRICSVRHPPYPIGLLEPRDGNVYGWRSFLGQEPGTDLVPTAAVPARVEDLKGLPPAWIGVGAIDIFVIESMEFAQRLIEAGVQTELVVVPGAFHGFDAYGRDKPVVQRFLDSRTNALRHGLRIRI